MGNMEIEYKFCIVTSPRSSAGIHPLSNLVNIMLHTANQLFLITGNEGKIIFDIFPNLHGYSVTYPEKRSIFSRILAYITLQLEISFHVVNIWNKVDVFVFYMGESLFLPVLTLKILRKKVVLFLASSAPNVLEHKCKKTFISELLTFLETLNYSLCDEIIVYSPNLVREWKLEKYKAKILISHEHFLDLDSFRIMKNYSDRKYSVGYIGRFSEEKGILNFIMSLPSLLKNNPNLNVFIAGSGELKNKIESILESQNLNSNVILKDWISHQELPMYLNDLKLIVLPSYTEGLPNIMLEAMACGTPVLVTPVGAIPDFISDSETGFILDNNSSECIEKNIERVFNCQNIIKIITNAKEIINTNFTFEASARRVKEVLCEC